MRTLLTGIFLLLSTSLIADGPQSVEYCGGCHRHGELAVSRRVEDGRVGFPSKHQGGPRARVEANLDYYYSPMAVTEAEQEIRFVAMSRLTNRADLRAWNPLNSLKQRGL